MDLFERACAWSVWECLRTILTMQIVERINWAAFGKIRKGSCLFKKAIVVSAALLIMACNMVTSKKTDRESSSSASVGESSAAGGPCKNVDI